MNEIDLHLMSVIEARKYLKTYLNNLDSHVREVRVVHGYSNGNKLQSFVRKEFGHKKIERKILEMNPGVTVLLLARKDILN